MNSWMTLRRHNKWRRKRKLTKIRRQRKKIQLLVKLKNLRKKRNNSLIKSCSLREKVTNRINRFYRALESREKEDKYKLTKNS